MMRGHRVLNVKCRKGRQGLGLSKNRSHVPASVQPILIGPRDRFKFEVLNQEEEVIFKKQS